MTKAKVSDVIGKCFGITQMTKVACIKDMLFTVGKIAIGIIVGTIFMFFNAAYSLVAGSARIISLHVRDDSIEEQYKYCRLIAFMIMLFSLAYTAYMARSFVTGISTNFTMIIGIAIAAFTFGEFGFSIYDLVRFRKTQKPIEEAMKLISFAGILTCFPLTQFALLSINAETDYSIVNGITGIVFGSIAFIVGIYLLIKSKKQYAIQVNNLSSADNNAISNNEIG